VYKRHKPLQVIHPLQITSMTPKIPSPLAWILWPLLLALCISTTVLANKLGYPVIGFNLVYLLLAITLLILERLTPHEQDWSAPDGEIVSDILHTLVSKGTVQTLFVFSATIGLTAYITPMDQPGYGIWPRHLPLPLQVIMGIIVAEFGLYWAHRIGHEWPPLWHFHAIHHSVKKLWVVNTGRFHFIDTIKSIVPGMAILLVFGAPMEVITWLSAITAYIGILTHCNVEMRFGFLSAIFNTPELHRWHHSKDLREGNKNYGENIMIWDWVFGTWFNENRRPPSDIGIQETMPADFRKQLAWPFLKTLEKLRTT
jgi:sterol desaturase/sphingolipid hydroxylase (fatty acid hydroxylase superfamily)